MTRHRLTTCNAVLVIGVLLLFGCSSPPPPGQAVIEINLSGQAQNLPEGPLVAAPLFHSPDQTVTLLRMTEAIAPHRHLYSEETVYLIDGRGTLDLGTSTRNLRAGDVVVIPRNTLHGYTPTGDTPSVVLSIFVPAFQEGDRHP